MNIKLISKLIRLKHWIKNIVVLLPLLTSMKFSDFNAVLQVSYTFIAFCFLSSSVYIINDIHDRESDRLFKHNRQRPIASGRITLGTALCVLLFFTIIWLGISIFIGLKVLLILISYFLLQILYTWYFKQKVLLDVICIAIGFVLRTVSGTVAINVRHSPWLFVCMFTVSLFLGFCKRYMERINFEFEESNTFEQIHRPILIVYPKELLIHLISVSAGIAIISFLMYSISPSTTQQFRTDYIVYTLPLQIYCMFRFTMLTLKGFYANPVELIFRDRPLQIAAALFLCFVSSIIIWGTEIQQCLHTIFR